jgi:short-subunit dehydrogenase
MIVITGISKGLGKVIAEIFAKQGYTIAGCARNSIELGILKQDLESKYPIACYVQPADLSKAEDIDNFIDFLQNLPEKPTALIHNAALFQFGGLLEEDENLLATMLHTNLFSAYKLTKSLLPAMIEAKKGHIFSICSSLIHQVRNNMGSYGISKFALYGMTKILREELKPHSIKVTAVMLGSTYTDSWADSGVNPALLVDAKDVANAILAAFLQSPNSVTEEIWIRPQKGDLI